MHFIEVLLAITATAGLTLAAPQPLEVQEAKRAADAPPKPDDAARTQCPVWSTSIYPLPDCQYGIYGPQRVEKFSKTRAEGCQNLQNLEYGNSLQFDGATVFQAQVFYGKDCTGGSWTYVYADDKSNCKELKGIKSFKVQVQQGRKEPYGCGGYQ